MRKLIAAAFLVALSLSPLGATGSSMTGYVSDLKCASGRSNVAAAKDWIKNDGFESCATMCVTQGSEMVFVTEDNHVLHLDAASKTKATSHLGHRVSVSGTVSGTALSIDTISNIAFIPQD